MSQIVPNRSDKVGVLHGHVEALLNERVVVVDVGSWSDDSLRSVRVIDARSGLWSEALLCSIEHYTVLEVLAAWLVHRLGPLCIALSILVKTRPRHFQLQALSIEDLSVVESG